MIVVGLQGCTDCIKYYNIHPEYTYVELRKGETKSSPEILKIKKALGKLNFDRKFPALLSDDMKTLIPRQKLMQELVIAQKKHGGCSHCGGK